MLVSWNVQRTEEQRAEARDIAARDRTNIDDEEKKRRMGLGILMLVQPASAHFCCQVRGLHMLHTTSTSVVAAYRLHSMLELCTTPVVTQFGCPLDINTAVVIS